MFIEMFTGEHENFPNVASAGGDLSGCGLFDGVSTILFKNNLRLQIVVRLVPLVRAHLEEILCILKMESSAILIQTFI